MSRIKKDNIKRNRFTTLLPEILKNKIKILAIKKGKCTYEVIEEALKDYLKKEGVK
jgi:transcriptional regulator